LQGKQSIKQTYLGIFFQVLVSACFASLFLIRVHKVATFYFLLQSVFLANGSHQLNVLQIYSIIVGLLLMICTDQVPRAWVAEEQERNRRRITAIV
jgi:hypothetical protein